ncbi:hypothetical protein [Saccharothrix deserti]|nr:hypothetical protein [Saccharothrix deserti]
MIASIERQIVHKLGPADTTQLVTVLNRVTDAVFETPPTARN